MRQDNWIVIPDQDSNSISGMPSKEQFDADPGYYVVANRNGHVRCAYPVFDEKTGAFDYWKCTGGSGENGMILPGTVYAYAPIRLPEDIVAAILPNAKHKYSIFREVYGGKRHA